MGNGFTKDRPSLRPLPKDYNSQEASSSVHEPIFAKVRILGMDKFLEVEVNMDGQNFKPKALPFTSTNETAHENIPWIKQDGGRCSSQRRS